MTDFSYHQFLALIFVISQQLIPTIKMLEDVKLITEGSTPIGFNHKKSTPLSDINETIIREAELDVLIFEDDLFKTYNKSRPSSKKRKRDVNTYGYNFS